MSEEKKIKNLVVSAKYTDLLRIILNFEKSKKGLSFIAKYGDFIYRRNKSKEYTSKLIEYSLLIDFLKNNTESTLNTIKDYCFKTILSNFFEECEEDSKYDIVCEELDNKFNNIIANNEIDKIGDYLKELTGGYSLLIKEISDFLDTQDFFDNVLTNFTNGKFIILVNNYLKIFECDLIPKQQTQEEDQ